MATTVQLNVRMERSMRDAGNMALESIGLSPSMVVRALWEMIAQRGQGLEDVVALLFADNEGRRMTEDVASPIDRGQALYDELLCAVGMEGENLSRLFYKRTDKQMREDALAERWREKGLNCE